MNQFHGWLFALNMFYSKNYTVLNIKEIHVCKYEVEMFILCHLAVSKLENNAQKMDPSFYSFTQDWCWVTSPRNYGIPKGPSHYRYIVFALSLYRRIGRHGDSTNMRTITYEKYEIAINNQEMENKISCYYLAVWQLKIWLAFK